MVPLVRLEPFRSSRRQANDNGVFEEWKSWPLRRSTQLLTHRFSAGTAGAFGAPAGVFFHRMRVLVPYRPLFGSTSVGSDSEESESIFLRVGYCR